MNPINFWTIGCIAILGCSTKDSDSGNTQTTNSCIDSDTPLGSFTLFPDLPATQIHADIAFDGSSIWTVFNLPNENGEFDVYLGSVDCRGNTVVPPKQVVNIPGLNQTTPRIAISGSNILVAAQGDNGESGNNLSIHLYVQNTDGEIITEREWTPTIDGVQIGNKWLPSISGDEDGFWLAAAAANDTHFQTAVQRLDKAGADIGAPFWVGPDSYGVFPNIDGTPNEFVVAWDSGEDSVQWTRGTRQDGETTDHVEYDNASSARILWNNGDPRLFANKRSPLTVTMNDAQFSLLGNSHFPNAAQGENTTMVGYYKIQSGYANDVYSAILSNGEAVEVDTVIQTSPSAAPYRPAITNLGGDGYLLVWSEGDNPNFILAGQFIDADPTKQ